MEILNALRTATHAVHTRIETLPVCQAMLAGEVDRDAYTALLGKLYYLHDRFESELAACPAVAAVWPLTPSRAQAIARDLAVLGAEPGECPYWIEEWVNELNAQENPAVWAGVGYVFEGSRMGSRVLVRTVSKALGLEMKLGNGLDYHLDAGTDPAGNWRNVMGALVALDRNEDARHAIVTAAVSTFEAMYDLHENATVMEMVEA
ncbi:hypothetical protein BH11PLA2_BH11PLA2_31470 [soil metagenome]